MDKLKRWVLVGEELFAQQYIEIQIPNFQIDIREALVLVLVQVQAPEVFLVWPSFLAVVILLLLAYKLINQFQVPVYAVEQPLQPFKLPIHLELLTKAQNSNAKPTLPNLPKAPELTQILLDLLSSSLSSKTVSNSE